MKRQLRGSWTDTAFLFVCVCVCVEMFQLLLTCINHSSYRSGLKLECSMAGFNLFRTVSRLLAADARRSVFSFSFTMPVTYGRDSISRHPLVDGNGGR